MPPEQCPDYAQLQAAVLDALRKIEALVAALLRAFQAGDTAGFKALDKALEEALGEKERRIGALRQHATDHQCQK